MKKFSYVIKNCFNRNANLNEGENGSRFWIHKLMFPIHSERHAMVCSFWCSNNKKIKEKRSFEYIDSFPRNPNNSWKWKCKVRKRMWKWKREKRYKLQYGTIWTIFNSHYYHYCHGNNNNNQSFIKTKSYWFSHRSNTHIRCIGYKKLCSS